ncbi:unnamed protein product [Discosporangium mesarthrocarpum]
MAGLTATRDLLRRGWSPREIVLLEASGDIGGRVQTRKHPSGFEYDEGAAYIHGQEGNPIGALAAEAGIKLKLICPRNPWVEASSSDLALFCDGVRSSDEEMAQTAQNFEQLMQLVGEVGIGCNEAWAPLKGTTEALLGSAPFVSLAPAEMARLCFRLLMLAVWNGCDLEELQLLEFAGDGEEEQQGYGDFPGPHCMVEGGMSKVVRAVATPKVMSCVRVNSRVTHITLRDASHGKTTSAADNHGSKIEEPARARVDWLEETVENDNMTCAGLGESPILVRLEGGEELKADVVVVTLPLTLLQDHLVFEPPLPEERRSILSRLSLGSYEKILIEFDQVFWPEDTPFIGCCTTHTSTVAGVPASTLPFPSGVPSGEGGLLLENYYWSKGVPVLAAAVSGAQARWVAAEINSAQKEGDTLIAKGLEEEKSRGGLMAGGGRGAWEVYQRMILPALEEAFGQVEKIPDPVSVVATSWSLKPLFRGSYSFFPLGAADTDVITSGKPIGNRLFFAGEATSASYQGSVHAAYLSGARAAEEVEELFSSARSWNK